MTSVETYWTRIASTAGDNRSWSDLSRNEQEMIVYSINLVLAVLNNFNRSKHV